MSPSFPRISKFLRLALGLLALAQASASPVVPELLKDINAKQQDSNTDFYLDMGGYFLLQGTDLAHGSELWRSNGTLAGTSMLADLQPGPVNSAPTPMAVAGGICYFAATVQNPGPGRELWKTDGTPGGTVLVKDIHPTSFSSPEFITAWGNRVIFAANDGTHGKELWLSDGTAAGTVMVKDLAPGPDSAFFSSGSPTFTVIGNTVYFAARAGTSDVKLWKTDGTPEGTVTVGGALFSSPQNLRVFGNELAFLARKTGSSVETLWRTGLGPDGVAELSTISSEALVVMGGALYFVESFGSSEERLYRSSGAVGAPTLLKTFRRVGALTSVPALSGSAAALYFFAEVQGDDPAGIELWKCDGSGGGTVRLVDLWAGEGDSYPTDFTVCGDRMFFTADRGDGGRQLWISNGSAAGTSMVREFSRSVSDLTTVGNLVVFNTDDGFHGRELWRSNGTPGGTMLVKDFKGSGDSDPDVLARAGNNLFFLAKATDGQTKLHATDGTNAGTRETIPTTGTDAQPITASGALGNLLLFGTKDAAGDYELWKSDGSLGGTVRVTNINASAASLPQSFTEMAGYTLFTADDGVNGRELWRTDGTAGGTRLVKDLVTGPTGSSLANFAKRGAELFFTLPSGAGSQLWKTNGEDTGTTPVVNTTVPILRTIAVGDVLYYTVPENSPWIGLWRTDGTPGNEVKVTTLPERLFQGPSGVVSMAGSGGLLYLMGTGFPTGMELWRSDGSAAGTFRIFSRPEVLTNLVPSMTSFDRDLLFWVRGATGCSLWRSDGTEQGTALVRDLPAPGEAAYFYVRSQMSAGGALWFLAGGEFSGYELWKSDGSSFGTGSISLALPNPITLPGPLAVVGQKLLFPLLTDAYGEELYAFSYQEAQTYGDHFKEWAAGNDLSGAAAAASAEPQGDDVANLLKYAFFMDGSKPDRKMLTPGTGTSGLPVFSVTGAGSAKVLKMEYIRRRDSGLSYKPVISTSLANQSFLPMSGGETVTSIDAGRERVVVEHPVNVTTTPAVFGRVEVTGP